MRPILCVLICSTLLISPADAEPPKLVAVQQDRQWGFMDAKGNYVVEPQFDAIGAYSGGVIAVQQGGQWGFIDARGKYVIDPQFDGIGAYSGGVIAVRQGRQMGVYRREGKIRH